MEGEKCLNLVLISLILFFSATCLTLLVPFYSHEALARGVTVTQSGQVIGSIFLVNILLTPLVTRYVPVVGARTILLSGCIISALGNISYSFLTLLSSSNLFFIFSLVVRVVVGVGESAISATAYTLAAQQAGPRDQGKVLGLTEACFGAGTMLGPCLGGYLYQGWGFAIPFLVSGLALLLTGMASCVLLTSTTDHDKQGGGGGVEVSWCDILCSDGVMVSIVMNTLASSAYAWYTASLAPYLTITYSLTVGQTGLVLLVNGLLYTSFTPVFGWLTDHYITGLQAQILGNLLISTSYMFIGPIPPLESAGVGHHVWVLCAAVGVQGVGSAALYLGSLLHMMRAVSGQGEESQAMVSSLWCVAEWVGAYVGASMGSWSYDTMGFATGTMVEGALVMMVTMLVMGLTIKQRVFSKKKDRRTNRGVNYKQIPDYEYDEYITDNP